MSQATKNTMKYIGSAMAIGGTVMLGSGLLGGRHSMKKKAKKAAVKAIDAIEGIMNGVQDIIG